MKTVVQVGIGVAISSVVEQRAHCSRSTYVRTVVVVVCCYYRILVNTIVMARLLRRALKAPRFEYQVTAVLLIRRSASDSYVVVLRAMNMLASY